MALLILANFPHFMAFRVYLPFYFSAAFPHFIAFRVYLPFYFSADFPCCFYHPNLHGILGSLTQFHDLMSSLPVSASEIMIQSLIARIIIS